jgi:hypothetical protein
MSGESSVSRSSRLTKLRVTPSASAISAADRNFPSSSIRFHRCALASARISASSGRGLAGPAASEGAKSTVAYRDIQDGMRSVDDAL